MMKRTFNNIPLILRIGFFVASTTFILNLFFFVYNIPEKIEKVLISKTSSKPNNKREEEKPKGIRITKIHTIEIDSNSPREIVPIQDCNKVLPVIYTKPVNFNGLNKNLKKKKFIAYMLPQILIVNHKIEQKRKTIIKIKDKLKNEEDLTEGEEAFLTKLLTEYKAKSIDELIERLHTNPPSLILAQAIAESGWGTSRFYLEAKNAFGITAFNRTKYDAVKMYGANIYLRKYDKIIDSIQDYYYSINVSWAFKRFRKVRLSTQDPFKLSKHLTYYSTLREVYIKRITRIIKINNLKKFDKCKLDPVYFYEDSLYKNYSK